MKDLLRIAAGSLPRLALAAAVLDVLFGANPEAAAQTVRSFAVLKCKFKDQPQEPAFDPNFIIGPFGMAAYWSGISYGQVTLNGSAVFPANGGWYTLPITLAEAAKLTRLGRIQACIDAATDVDTSKYYSVVAIINAAIDSGASGGKVLLDPLAWSISFAAHEMGHAFGLDHSFDDSPKSHDPTSDGRPGAYGDGWDIMSAMTFGSDPTTFAGAYGTSGPGLNSTTLEKLGWMPANRILNWDGLTSATVTLAALNQPAANGFLVVKVPSTADPSRYYTVEFRRKKDWDQGIPQDTVLIHDVRAGGLSYLIRAGGGAERLPGETFHDAANNVAISVLRIDAATSTAVVNIGRNDVWADFNYRGASELGTFENPYNTLAEGVNAVAEDGTLRIKTSASNESITIARKMRIEAFGGPVTIGP